MDTNIRRRKVITKAAVAVFLVAGATAWMARSSKAEQAAPAPTVSRPALTVRTTGLREDKWARTLMANGSILPWQEAIISAQVQGLRIAEVKVSIGDHVRAGDVLVTLDNFTRLGADTGTVQGRIVAPDDGVISAANANAGSMAQPGVELFRLIRKERLEWRAELTADELMLLRKGMPAEIAVGEGRIIKGIVRAISPSVNPQTRYGYALVTLPDSSGIIAGAFVHGTFDISGGKKTLQSLPQSAIMQRGVTTYALVVGDDSRVHERVVKVGQRSGDRVEIKQGLKANEPVIESGGAFLTEGDVVQIVKG